MFTRIITKIFAKCDSYGRGCLHHNMLFRIINCIPYLVDIRLLNESTGWTTVDALAAICTYHMTHRSVMERRYLLVHSFISDCNC